MVCMYVINTSVALLFLIKKSKIWSCSFNGTYCVRTGWTELKGLFLSFFTNGHLNMKLWEEEEITWPDRSPTECPNVQLGIRQKLIIFLSSLFYLTSLKGFIQWPLHYIPFFCKYHMKIGKLCYIYLAILLESSEYCSVDLYIYLSVQCTSYLPTAHSVCTSLFSELCHQCTLCSLLDQSCSLRFYK